MRKRALGPFFLNSKALLNLKIPQGNHSIDFLEAYVRFIAKQNQVKIVPLFH